MKDTDCEVRYCTSCGAVNKRSAVRCSECEEKITKKHSPFMSFLLKRIKGKAFDKGSEKLFEIIREFLFQHLYGVILTVSVVVTSVVVAANPTPYIKEVTEFPAAVNSEIEKEAEKTIELTEYDHARIDHVISAYDAVIDNTLRPFNTYWAKPEEYSSGSELWAENNIEGYPYHGDHDMFENPITLVMETRIDEFDTLETEPYGQRDWIEQSIVTGSNVKSELGQTLYKNGYDVLEIDYYLMTIKGYMPDYDFDAPLPEDKEFYEKLKYVFLLTRKTGEEKWYIAEEKLVERFGI